MIIKMFFMLFIVFRMFYLPYLSGKFLIKTSDVGSIISSMDTLRVPKNISIPVAVMFRFFPSFKEEKDNIKMAMKIRGIPFKNPISYLEYVIVPLLIISSNIADDISKAAETRCIENPIKKERYISVRIKGIDFVLCSFSFNTGDRRLAMVEIKKFNTVLSENEKNLTRYFTNYKKRGMYITYRQEW